MRIRIKKNHSTIRPSRLKEVIDTDGSSEDDEEENKIFSNAFWAVEERCFPARNDSKTQANETVGDRKEKKENSSPTTVIEGCTNSTKGTVTDSIGRMVCEHQREYCLVCCVDYRRVNRVLEEAVGLRKKETKVEQANRMYRTAAWASLSMETMHPRPNKDVLDQHDQWNDEYEAKMEAFWGAKKEDIETEVNEAVGMYAAVSGDIYLMEKTHPRVRRKVFDRKCKLRDNLEAKLIAFREAGKMGIGDHCFPCNEIELEAIVLAMARMYPGQTTFELGGEEHQKLYDKFVRAPQGRENRVDCYTCSYCGKTGTKHLLQCSICGGVSYCGKECQLAAWPSHRKYQCCKKNFANDLKKQRLTWNQVRAYNGQPANGKLEVKILFEELFSPTPGKFLTCKDRNGNFGTVGNWFSHPFPELSPGDTLIWKNPRAVDYVGKQTMACIEPEEWENIEVLGHDSIRSPLIERVRFSSR